MANKNDQLEEPSKLFELLKTLDINRVLLPVTMANVLGAIAAFNGYNEEQLVEMVVSVSKEGFLNAKKQIDLTNQTAE